MRYPRNEGTLHTSYIPIVPRPPILKRPKRANGAEHVMMLGVICRITITEDGSEGMSLEVILALGSDLALWSRRSFVDSEGCRNGLR